MKINIKQERRCTEGFIEDYLRYTSKLECPKDFNTWVALSLVSNALGRRCWSKETGYQPLYPNLYIILVGPSAIGKGIALGTGAALLKDAIPDQVPVFSQRGTVESLITFLGDVYKQRGASECLIHIPELATLLGRSKFDAALLHELTAYYDCPDMHSYSTKTQGWTKLRNVCVRLQAGSTPEWMKDSLPEESIGGGFFARLILVHRTDKPIREPFPFVDANMRTAREKCLNDLMVISNMKGKFEWEQEAKSLYSDWLCDYLDKEREENPPNLDGYFGRKKVSLVKVAMAYSASFDDSKVIHEADIQFALDLLSDNEAHLRDLIEQLARTTSGKLIDHVRKLIKKKGVIDRAELQRRLSYKVNTLELQQLVDSLTMGDEITPIRKGRRWSYRWVPEEERKRQASKETEKTDAIRINVKKGE